MKFLLLLPMAFIGFLYQSIHLAVAQIWANKMRSVLTMLGIIIGVASVIDGDTIEIHGQRIRLHGIDVLASHRIKEGMPLCIDIMDIEKWGKRDRIKRCLVILGKYGAAAKPLPPPTTWPRILPSTGVGER